MADKPDNKLDVRRKRLKYLAEHRGIKEADILLGRFVDQNLASFDDRDVDWFEALFNEQDVDILAWITGNVPPPDDFDTPMMDRMKTLDHMKK
ncbi:MAG: FAD assembly factor SdhE [Alphaproteobacteria bacterium]